MGFHIEGLTLERIHRLAGGEHHIQQLIHTHIHFLFGDAAILHGFDQLVRAVTAGGRHLQMASCAHSLGKVIVCAPVGNDKAVKAPVIPQDLLQKVGIFIGIDTVDHVIGGHDGLRVPFLHGDFKIGQVNLTQSTFIHHRVGCHAPQLRVVGSKVLRACGNPVSLDAADIACSHLTCKVGIFREILKVSPAERIALDVEARPQQDTHILARRLCPEMLTQLLAEGRIPGVCHGRSGGIAGCRDGAIDAQLISRSFLFADTVGTIG